jgi:hypothetical protein
MKTITAITLLATLTVAACTDGTNTPLAEQDCLDKCDTDEDLFTTLGEFASVLVEYDPTPTFVCNKKGYAELPTDPRCTLQVPAEFEAKATVLRAEKELGKKGMGITILAQDYRLLTSAYSNIFNLNISVEAGFGSGFEAGFSIDFRPVGTDIWQPLRPLEATQDLGPSTFWKSILVMPQDLKAKGLSVSCRNGPCQESEIEIPISIDRGQDLEYRLTGIPYADFGPEFDVDDYAIHFQIN